jgi:hypothetical protein
VAASSIALIAFGLDSLVEAAAGGVALREGLEAWHGDPCCEVCA